MTTAAENKAIVRRFNTEIIEQGNLESVKELLCHDVINHVAPAGTPPGSGSMTHFLFNILRKGFPDIQVEIFDQIAEGDKVTTRKALHGTHLGEFMGISATHKKVTIHVIDIIKIREGKYGEHWGMSNLSEIVKELAS